MIKERRKHARLRIPLEAEYLVAGEEAWRQGTIWTLGAGGAALLCDERLAEGAVLEGLHFVVAAEGDLPETRIEVGAEVVNVDRQGDFGCRSCFMLGLRFRGLGEQEFELLRQFVFRRLTGAQEPVGEVEAEPGAPAGAPPIEIRFKLFDEFVEEVSENLSPSGMFIRAHRPLPPGSKFVFQFQLGEDFSLFQGTAEVVWTRRRSEGPGRPPGMGVRFVKLDLTSQRMVRRLVDQRDVEEASGSGATALAAEPPPPAAPVVDPESSEAAAETAPGEASRSRLQRRVEQLEERLVEAEAAGAEARERLAGLEAEAGTLREEAGDLRSSCAAAEDARDHATSEASELRRELEEEVERSRQALARRQAEGRALEAELRERLDRSEASRSDLARQAERAEGAASDLEALRQESAEARREWDAIEEELRAQLEQQGAERADLQDRLSQAVDVTAELRQRLAEAGGARDELAEQVAQSSQVEALLCEQAQELRAARDELAARLDRATEQLRKMRGVAEEMRSRLDGDLTAARDLDSDLADRLAEVAAAGSKLDEKVGGLNAARAGLADRLARLGEAWSGLEKGLAESEAGEGELEPERSAVEPEGPAVEPECPAVEPESPTVEPEGSKVESEGPLVEPEAPVVVAAAEPEPRTVDVESAAEPESAAAAADDANARQPAPTAAARLVGAARRAAARLGLARDPATDGNGSAPGPEPVEPEAVVDAESARSGDGAATVAIDETVRAWAAAWSEQRVDEYLSFYSREFAPARPAGDHDTGEAPPAWLPPLDGMELTLGPISHTELAPGRFAVQFEQSVATDAYTRRTGRTLELVREADAWKIAAESFQEL